MSFELDYLCDHMDWAPVLARWHHAEWGQLMPYWSEADALTELRSHTGRCRVPTTVVAIGGSAGAPPPAAAGKGLPALPSIPEASLLGSVSLVVKDFEEWPQYTPWLASLLVKPEARGRGIGQDLVRRVVADAAALGLPRVYVVASDSELFYARLGWRVLERAQLRRHDTTVMYIDP